MLDQVIMFAAIAFGIAVIAVLASTFFTVEQRTTAVVQRLGKLVREARPGLHTKVPFASLSEQMRNAMIEANTIEAARVRAEFPVGPEPRMATEEPRAARARAAAGSPNVGSTRRGKREMAEVV